MSRFATISAAPPGKAPAGSSSIVHRIFFALFLVSFLMVLLETVQVLALHDDRGWLAALLVVTAGVTTMVSFSRQLPAQNVLLAAVIIAAIAGTVQALGAISGIPFGPYLYTEAAGPKLFNVLPWAVPVVWIVILLNARGVARIILRPWRKSRLYGFRLIGVTAALALAFDFGLEPFATQVNHYWLWQPTKLPLLWQGTPPSNFLGWLVTALVVLAFVTPVMINKSHKKYPSDYYPLIVWVLLSALFATGAVSHQLWVAAGFIGLTGMAVTVLAIRGARW